MARRLADDGDPGTSRRSVADLLREAGIEQSTGPRRRRRFIEEEDDEPAIGSTSDDVPIPAPESDAAPDSGTGRVPVSDPVSEAESRPKAEPNPGDDNRPESTESTDSSDSSGSAGSADSADSAEQDDETDADGPVDETGPIGQVDDDETGPIDQVEDSSSEGEPADVPDELRNFEAAAISAKPARERSGAVHWTLAIGEVILAIAIGVGLSFVFRLLWDIAPYAAAILAPVVICAVVAIVGFSRKKMGLGSIPLSLLLLVLFVTALLVVLPAAWVLTAP